MFQVTERPEFILVIGTNEEENLAKIYAQRWIDYFRQAWKAFALDLFGQGALVGERSDMLLPRVDKVGT